MKSFLVNHRVKCVKNTFYAALLIMSGLWAVEVQAQSPAQLARQITALQATVAGQAATIATLQKQVTLMASNSALILGPYVTVNPYPKLGVAGPNITFHSCNVHVNSGTGATDDYGASIELYPVKVLSSLLRFSSLL
jgi:hypothetical protein